MLHQCRWRIGFALSGQRRMGWINGGPLAREGDDASFLMCRLEMYCGQGFPESRARTHPANRFSVFRRLIHDLGFAGASRHCHRT